MNKIKQYIAENFAAEQSPWLAVVPFLFALGIALYFALPIEPNIWYSLGIFELWLLLFYLCRRTNWHLFFIGIIIIMCGFLNIQAHTIYQTKHVKFLPPELTYLSGRILDISYSAKGKERLLLTDVSDYNNPRYGNYRVTLTVPQKDISIGNCVEMAATVFPPSRIPLKDGFQLNRKYFYEGLSGSGFANSEAFPIKCEHNTSWLASWQSQINQKRYQISQKIRQILPENTAGIAEAVLIGEKSNIPEKIIEQYRNSGLAHFLSVSGLHLGAIAGLVFFIVRWLLALFPSFILRYDGKKFAAVAAIIFSTVYLLISGMAIPAQRAYIMTLIVLIGVIFDRQAISMRMVSIAALTILLIAPQSLISISFQMSFAAVYALVAFYEKFSTRIPNLHSAQHFIGKIFWYLLGIIICDFVASIATAPFSLYHFHQLAIYTSLGNLLAGPLIGLVLMPLILISLIGFIFSIELYPLKLLGYGITLLNQITAYVSGLSGSLWQTDALSFTGFILIILGGYWLCIWHQKWRRLGIILILCGLLSMFFYKTPDIIISPNIQCIAIKNSPKTYHFYPKCKDNWIKQVWMKNFPITENSSSDNWEDKKIKILPPNEITLDNHKFDATNGAYIYFNDNGSVSFIPFWSKTSRPWNFSD